MAIFTALYDASVLYPAPVRDLLMYLALSDLFRAKWTNKIHEEWIRAVLRNRPDLKRSQLERTRMLMDENVRDCLIEGYADLIDGLHLPDPDDRHVLAAAIRGRCDVIVTCNLKDFPEKELNPLGIEVQHPDFFVTHLIDLAPAAVCLAVRRHRSALKSPPKSLDEYFFTLEKHGLSTAVHKLKEFSEKL